MISAVRRPAQSYAIDAATGMLTLLNRQSTSGSIPAHLAIAPDSRAVVLGNYVGGNFAALPIGTDGRLGPATSTVQNTGSGPNKQRQEAPHPHCVAYDPAGRYIATADLGIDMIQVFRLDTAGKLIAVGEAKTAAGAGPRHLAFHPDGRFLYVVNELDATVAVFPYDAASGKLGAAIQTISTVPTNFVGTKSTAEIVVHPSGKFLFSSNRGQPDATTPEANAIVSFAIDATGKLTLVGHTTAGIKYPRNFALDPTGTLLYACNQQADTIVQFRINTGTGQLTATGQVTQTPTPVCLAFATVAPPAPPATGSGGNLPGLPNTGGGGMANDGQALGLLGAAGLGVAALAALSRHIQATDESE